MLFIQNDHIPTIPDDVISRFNDKKEAIIISMDVDDKFYKLDGVSAEIWSSIDGKKSWKKILSPVLREYEVTKERLDKDMAKLVSDLEEHSLISSSPSSPSQ